MYVQKLLNINKRKKLSFHRPFQKKEINNQIWYSFFFHETSVFQVQKTINFHSIFSEKNSPSNFLVCETYRSQSNLKLRQHSNHVTDMVMVLVMAIYLGNYKVYRHEIFSFFSFLSVILFPK